MPPRLVLGEQVLVFGGGTETSTDAVQALPAPGGIVAAGTVAETVGRLPTVRSDLSAVTVGETAYVLGGYDGSKPIDSVLATTDGSTFTQVAKLPAPGPLPGGRDARRPHLRLWRRERERCRRDAIQEVDPRAGTRPGSSATCRRPSPTPARWRSAGSVYVLGGEVAGLAERRGSGASNPAKAVSPAGRAAPADLRRRRRRGRLLRVT